MSPRQTTYICVPLSTLFWIKPSPCHQGKQHLSRLHKHYSYMVYQGFTDTVLMASHCPTVHKVFYKWHYPLLPIKQRKMGKDSDIWVLYRSSPPQINKENGSWTSIHCRKAQWVWVHQRIALYKSYLLLLFPWKFVLMVISVTQL